MEKEMEKEKEMEMQKEKEKVERSEVKSTARAVGGVGILTIGVSEAIDTFAIRNIAKLIRRSTVCRRGNTLWKRE